MTAPKCDKGQDDRFIVLEDVWKTLGGTKVFCGLNLAIRRGETMVVIGESGCGKSVLLKHIIGIMLPDRGKVFVEDVNIDELSEDDLAPLRRRFGMVFQGSALFDSMNVFDNVAFGLRRINGDGKSEEEIEKIVNEKLHLVGLSDVGEKMPAEISGGMKKRVAIARAIAIDPEVILYDEPTTGLDPIMADVVNELIIRVQKEECATSIVVTHDMKSAYKVGNRIAMIHKGEIVFTGTPEETQGTENPVVSQFIRGEAGERMEERVGA